MNTISTVIKCCQLCKKPIRGRSDKKFCNDYCRNGYNNQSKSTQINVIRNINNALLKNRKILKEILPEGCPLIKVKREKLLQSGYFFNYNTSIYKNKKGSIYYYCYDCGMMPLNEEWCIVFINENIE
jgi:hypothetical protein